jgi:hypothetical protein
VALTTAVAWPAATAPLAVVKNVYQDSHFVPTFSPVWAPRIFALGVTASVAGAAADAARAVMPNEPWRVAEAVVGALGAVAVYTSLGGTLLAALLLVAILSFTAALSDGFYVLVFALLVTLWDAPFSSAPRAVEQALLGAFYVAYALGTELSRPGSANLTVAVTTAGRITALWLSYAALAGLQDTPEGSLSAAVYLAVTLPAVTVAAFVAFDKQAEAAPPPVQPLVDAFGVDRQRRTKRRSSRERDFVRV